MMTEGQRYEVRDEPEASRYVLIDRESESREIGEEGYLDVSGSETTQRVMYHTSVSEQYGGQGLASVLVRAAVEDTIGRGFRVVPVCPYVVAWLGKHPEYAEHVDESGPQHLRAVAAHTR